MLGHKVRPTLRTDSSAITVVPNIIGRMDAQLSIPLLSLYDLIGKAFNFFLRTY
jgi:hypothetical protein